MSEIENNQPVPIPSQPRGVVDPAWEDELRRGQAAEGEAGSVDGELSTLHLLRHLREPEALAPDQLDALWSAIEPDLGSVALPWWRKAWIWWSAPALAAAAVLAVIVVQSDPRDSSETVARTDDAKREAAAAPAPTRSGEKFAEDEPDLSSRSGSRPESAGQAPGAVAAEEAEAPASDGAIASKADRRGAGGSNAFENSFQQLAPYGRRAIRGSVDNSLDELRGELLADARGGR